VTPFRAAVVLARPRLAPWVLLLLACGYGFGHWEPALDLQGAGAFARLAGAWLCLHVGTMWLNAARDRDEGPVLLGGSAPPPRWLPAAGACALGLCVLLAAWGPRDAAIAAIACVALSAAYSAPGIAWKGRPVLGPAVNVLGYGLLTPLAGYAAVGGGGLGPRSLAAGLVLAAGVAGLTFAAQVFQQAEDAGRGDRTLVVTHGPAACVRAGRIGFVLAAAGVCAMAAFGWLPRGCLVAAPVALLLDRHMARWARDPVGGGAAAARRALHLLALEAVAVVAAATVAYVLQLPDPPVAGQATLLIPTW
jgi:hypothetical protein